MAQNRNDRQQSQNQGMPTPILSEFLRQASEPKADEGKDDGSIPVFWKVFGSTLLSISAMVLVTAYQSLSSNVAEVRNDMASMSNDMHKEMARLAENQSELVKQEEAETRLQGIWRNVKELQEDKKQLTAIKERCASLTEIHKAAERDRCKLSEELKTLREQRIQQEERRALAAELAALRERLAGLEGKQATKPATPATSSDAPKQSSGMMKWFGESIRSLGWHSAYSSDPNRRMQDLLNQSEDLREIEREWERFWMNDQPSHLTLERIHGEIQ